MIKATMRRFHQYHLGRTLFWNAVHEVAPAVGAELFDTVGPAYKVMPQNAFVYPKPGTVIPTDNDEARADDEDYIANMAYREALADDAPEGMRWPVSYYDLIHASPQDEDADTLLGRLRDWATKFNFNARDTWVLDNALYSLRLWTENPKRQSQPLRVLSGGTDPFSVLKFSCKIKLEWDVQEHSRAWFAERVRRRIDRELGRFYKRAADQGWPEVVLKDKNAFRWLAQYQILKMSPNDIMNATDNERERVSKDSVRAAVHARAEMIRLTLRPAARGPRSGQTVVRR